MSDDKIKTAFIIIGGAVIVVLAIFLITYRDSKIVTIDDRRWRYEVAVKYDVTTISIDCATDSEGHTSCKSNPHTTTYTRCRTGLQGNALPVVKPELGCSMHSGDYIRERIYFDVFYHTDNGKSGSSEFDGSQWDKLQPRQTAKLITTAFNFIVGIEAK